LTVVVTAPNPLVGAPVLIDLVEKATIRQAIGTDNMSESPGLLLAT
jgi:hypothetical protein